MKTPWLRFNVTVSGDQGPIVAIDQVLPLCLLPQARALQQRAQDLVKIHTMTTSGMMRVDIARRLGRSPGWVRDRQRDLGLVE